MIPARATAAQLGSSGAHSAGLGSMGLNELSGVGTFESTVRNTIRLMSGGKVESLSLKAKDWIQPARKALVVDKKCKAEKTPRTIRKKESKRGRGLEPVEAVGPG